MPNDQEFDLGPDAVLFLYSRGRVFRLTGELVDDRQVERALAAAIGGGADAARRIFSEAATATREEPVPQSPVVPAVKSYDCPICWRRGPAAERLDARRVRCGKCGAIFVPGAKSPMASVLAGAPRRSPQAPPPQPTRIDRLGDFFRTPTAWLRSKAWLAIAVAGLAFLAIAVVVALRFPGNTRPALYSATGEATFEGKSIPGAAIVLHPIGEKSPSIPNPRGTVGEDGRFVLGTYAANDGAPAGEYGVSVQWFPPPSSKDENAMPRNLLPARYARHDTSGVTMRIEPGENRLPPLRLKR